LSYVLLRLPSLSYTGEAASAGEDLSFDNGSFGCYKSKA